MINNARERRLSRALYCFFIVITVGKAAAPTRVTAGPLDEANLAFSEQQALTQFLDARLALEKWTLRHLLVLYNDGNASWHELARQQTLVDTLKSQRSATHQFALFCKSLRDCVKQSNAGKNTSQLAERANDLPSIKLTLPGSQRLVGLLPWDQASAALRISHLSAMRAAVVSPTDARIRIEFAREKVAKYEQKVRKLADLTESQKATNDLARADLELTIARAELSLAEVMRARQQSDSARLQRMTMNLEEEAIKGETANATTKKRVSLERTDEDYISHTSYSALRTATLRSAAYEARIKGALRVAEINLQRLQRQADELNQLHAAGLSTRRDVEKAREEIDSANALLETLRAQQSRIIDAYELLCQLAKQDDFEMEPCRVVSTVARPSSAVQHTRPDLMRLPMSCFANTAVVRHVIDINRDCSNAMASRGAVLAELRMLEGLEIRLTKAQMSLAARPTRDDAPEIIDDTRAALAGGRQRELENVRLNIELKKAQLLATEERLQANRLEADRFARQITQQCDQENAIARDNGLPNGSLQTGEQFVAVVTRRPFPETEHAVSVQSRRLQRTPCYFESRNTFINAKRCALASAIVDLAESEVAFYPIGLRHSPSRLRTPSVLNRAYNHLRDGNAFRYSPQAFASPSSSYFDEYDAFGSRRAETDTHFRQFHRRRLVTYLPGTPERLPGTPCYLPGTPRRYGCEWR